MTARERKARSRARHDGGKKAAKAAAKDARFAEMTRKAEALRPGFAADLALCAAQGDERKAALLDAAPLDQSPRSVRFFVWEDTAAVKVTGTKVVEHLRHAPERADHQAYTSHGIHQHSRRIADA